MWGIEWHNLHLDWWRNLSADFVWSCFIQSSCGDEPRNRHLMTLAIFIALFPYFISAVGGGDHAKESAYFTYLLTKSDSIGINQTCTVTTEGIVKDDVGLHCNSRCFFSQPVHLWTNKTGWNFPVSSNSTDTDPVDWRQVGHCNMILQETIQSSCQLSKLRPKKSQTVSGFHSKTEFSSNYMRILAS